MPLVRGVSGSWLVTCVNHAFHISNGETPTMVNSDGQKYLAARGRPPADAPLFVYRMIKRSFAAPLVRLLGA